MVVSTIIYVLIQYYLNAHSFFKFYILQELYKGESFDMRQGREMFNNMDNDKHTKFTYINTML